MTKAERIQKAAQELLADVDMMAVDPAGRTDKEYWFGGFSEWEPVVEPTIGSAAFIEWPNLRISAELLREALNSTEGDET